jgi:capsular exopolysaccharide synthesis family protein
VQPKAKAVAVGQDVSGMGAAGYGWFAEEKYHNTQVEIIKSRDVALRVINKLDLLSHPDFQKVAESSDPIDVFRAWVQVVPRRETGLIEISIYGADKVQITEWVNAVADVYVARNLEKAQDSVDVAMETIRTQMEQMETGLGEAEDNRFDALAKSALSSEEQEEIVRAQLKTFNADLTEVELELNQLGDSLREIQAIQARGDNLMSLPELADDLTLKELFRSEVELERELESAKVLLRPDHPDYEKTASELEKVRRSIADQVGVILGTLRTRYGLLQDRKNYLEDQIGLAETASVAVARSASEYGVAKFRAETSRNILDVIYKTMNEVQVGMSMMSNNVSVLDYASVPRYAVKPRKKLNLMIGAVLGMFLGLAAAFFLDYLDNTFRTPEDVEKHLGLAVLGVIPKVGVDDPMATRTYKEAYQSLRTSVIFSSKNRQRRVMLLTSTGPQEGKSSTVANLGHTLAQAGDSVLIVDCDLRRPTQHVRHKLDRDNGLTNYLAAPLGSTDWSGVIKTTNQPNLQVITCGPIPPSPPELLGAERFTELIAALREEYDWVLIDSPPATSLADATLLAAVADMVVLVVQYNKTDRDVTVKTLQRLRAVNPAVAGAALNNVDLDRAFHKDYYYAGYYFEDGEKRAKKKRRRRRVEPKAHVG